MKWERNIYFGKKKGIGEIYVYRKVMKDLKWELRSMKKKCLCSI